MGSAERRVVILCIPLVHCLETKARNLLLTVLFLANHDSFVDPTEDKLRLMEAENNRLERPHR
jgi:hypothetical protein